MGLMFAIVGTTLAAEARPPAGAAPTMCDGSKLEADWTTASSGAGRPSPKKPLRSIAASSPTDGGKVASSEKGEILKSQAVQKVRP